MYSIIHSGYDDYVFNPNNAMGFNFQLPIQINLIPELFNCNIHKKGQCIYTALL